MDSQNNSGFTYSNIYHNIMVRQAVFALLALILPHVLADGYPKVTPDTPFITGSTGGSHSDSGNGGYPPVSMDYESRYRGPVATIMVLPDGHIADTAEVNAARATHLTALDKAKVLWAGAGGDQGSMDLGGSSGGGDSGYSYSQPDSNTKGSGPNSGQIHPTPQGGSGGSGGQEGSPGGGYSYPQPGSNTLGSGPNSGQSYLPPQAGSGGSGGQGQGGSSAAAVGSMPYSGPLAMLMVLPDGHIAETAEVTAARAAHLAALDKAKALWTQTGAMGGQGSMGHRGSPGASAGGNGGYSYPKPGSSPLMGGPNNDQSYLPPHPGTGGNGGQGQGGSSAAAAGNMPYSGPLAMLMVLPDGHIADTAEVAAARAAHLAALDKAKALWTQTGAMGGQGSMGHGGSPGASAGGNGGYSYPQPGSSSLMGGPNNDQSYLPPHPGTGGNGGQGQGGSSAGASGTVPYNGPLAMHMVLPTGFLADTPDIAALRAAHISALIKAQAAWKPQGGSQH